ncbi:SDR family oxidoreductase [Marinobacter szutsaonensis]
MTGRILVTGATGFVGSRLVNHLADTGFAVIAMSRKELKGPFKSIQVQSLSNHQFSEHEFADVSAIIHCAARVHIMKESAGDPLAEFRAVNVDGTLNLARQAASAGVKRFVFISSIKVNGEQTHCGKPFTPDDAPSPEDAYGVSKFEAEHGLKELSAETGMEVVIIRPPLIYGPGVKGNFRSMATLIERGVPLPLGAIHNKRSMCALDNLVDLITACIDHPAAANQVFLAGDGEDLSTTELLHKVAKAKGKTAHLIPVPASILSICASLVGQKAVATRLLGSLQVDVTKARNLLGWEPPLSTAEGLRRCFDSGDLP